MWFSLIQIGRMKDTEAVFIKSYLDKWSNKYNDIHIRYYYDHSTEFHVVEVAPESIRRDNPEYQKDETEMWSEFLGKYEGDLLIGPVNCADSSPNIEIIFDNDMKR